MKLVSTCSEALVGVILGEGSRDQRVGSRGVERREWGQGAGSFEQGAGVLTAINLCRKLRCSLGCEAGFSQ